MLDVLLITQDQNLITEIEKIAAVTGCTLRLTNHANNQEIQSARTVLIDASVNQTVSHPDVVLITLGMPGVKIWQKAVETGAKYVAFLPDAREWLITNLVPMQNSKAKVIGFLGSSGGIGCSTVASLIASNFLKLSDSVLLSETSTISGGLDVLWGVEDTKGLRFSDLTNTQNQINAKDVIRNLPKSDGLSILSTDSRKALAVSNQLEIISHLAKGCEYLIIDLPKPGTKNFVDLLDFCDQIVLLVGTTIRSISAANQLVSLYPLLKKSKLLVRQLPGTNLDSLNIAKTLEISLTGTIPNDVRIVEQLEQGISPAQLVSSNIHKALTEIQLELETFDFNVAA